MKTSTSASQKVGMVIFTIGAMYMFGLGWLYSWAMVPTANQIGSSAYTSGSLGFAWGLSVPLGAFIVAIGAALIAKAGGRVLGLLVLLLVLCVAWQIIGTTQQMIPALFGVGGGLITLFFLGSTWNWAKTRPALTGASRTGSDLRMIGFIFFVVAAWELCGIFGVGNFVLRPELADKFSVPLSSTINSASRVNILFVLGWGFTYLGQRMSLRAHAAEPEVKIAPQSATYPKMPVSTGT